MVYTAEGQEPNRHRLLDSKNGLVISKEPGIKIILKTVQTDRVKRIFDRTSNAVLWDKSEASIYIWWIEKQ